MSADDDIKFNFYYQGGKVETLVYDENQYRYKQFMAPVVKIDTTKSILSPMPGAVVSVSVQPGDTVVDGQDLCIIEAMKMQNILKSEREGVIKSVNVKAGDSVTVDELLIEFEWCWNKQQQLAYWNKRGNVFLDTLDSYIINIYKTKDI